MTDFKKSQVEIMVDLIKKDNPGSELKPTEIYFTDVVQRTPTPDLPRNTEVTMRVSDVGSKYKGTRTFYYNRIDINDFKYDGLVTEEHLTIDPGTVLLSDDLHLKLSKVFDIRIDKDMIVSETLPVVVSDPVPYTVVFKPTNLTIIGDLEIQLKR